MRLALALPLALALCLTPACSCAESHTMADAAPSIDATALLDASVPPLDAPGADASSAPDAAERPDAGGAECTTHRLAAMRIEELVSLESLDVHAGRSFRVSARYTQPDGCHRRAMTRVEIDPSTRMVDLTVRDWVEDGRGCPELAREDARVVTLRLESGDWTIRDASPGGTASLAITIGPAIRAACVPDGGDCLQNCDCLGHDVCLSTLGIGGPFTACAEPCEEDLDCSESGARCVSVDDGFDQSCEPTSSGCAVTGCPEGYECGPERCTPTFTLGASTRAPCTCDAECAPGLSCVTGTGGGRCEVACPTGSGLWCSSMHFCAEARMDVSGLAASDAVCGWVGE